MRTAIALLCVFALGWTASRWHDPAPASAAGPGDFSDVIETAGPSIVHVTNRLKRGAMPKSRDDAVGAGFLVSADGLIVTSRHVLSGADVVVVGVPGRGVHRAEVLGVDDATDIALLRVPVRGCRPLPVGRPASLRLGQWVLAAGSPYRLAHSWSAGIVSGLHRKGIGVNPRGYESYIQTDAAAHLGNSGGPLLDMSGSVVGVVTATFSGKGGYQGITLAIPIDVVMQTVRRMQGGGGTPPTLGLRGRDVTIAGRAGLQITGFDPGSPAARAGLAVGDLIVAFEGKPIGSAAELRRAVGMLERGARVTIRYRRPPTSTKSTDVQVTLR